MENACASAPRCAPSAPPIVPDLLAAPRPGHIPATARAHDPARGPHGPTGLSACRLSLPPSSIIAAAAAAAATAAAAAATVPPPPLPCPNAAAGDGLHERESRRRQSVCAHNSTCIEHRDRCEGGLSRGRALRGRAPFDAVKSCSSLETMVAELEVVVVPEIPGQLHPEQPLSGRYR